MEYILTEHDNCHLLEISGRVDSYTAPKIDKVLHSLILQDPHDIVIDLEKVTYISSSGILLFVNAQKLKSRKNQGKIHISGTSELVYSAFSLAGFNDLFEFHENASSAVNLLGK